MNEVLSSILPLSMGVALSPFPIIMIVLLLLGSARPKANGLAFLAGWVAGLAAIVTVLAFTLDALDSSGNDPGPIAGGLRIILGAALLVMAARKLIMRFAASDAGPLPRWMASAGGYSPGRSTIMGLRCRPQIPRTLRLLPQPASPSGPRSWPFQPKFGPWRSTSYWLP